MTSARMFAVLAMVWTVSALSALLALRVLRRRADPRRTVLIMLPRTKRVAWIGRVAGAARERRACVFCWPGTTVPLAWRNMLADKRRLLRSTGGIAFAVLLMLMQLGFRGAFIDSALEVIYSIDGDIFLTSSTNPLRPERTRFGAGSFLRGPRCRGRRIERGQSLPSGLIRSGRMRSTSRPTPSRCWHSIPPTSRSCCFR